MSRKPLFSYGAVALAAAVLLLAAPRAVHAIAATLVQVTNTAANPAIVQSPNTQAAQLVSMTAFATVATAAPLEVYTLNSTPPGVPYVVPNGQYLVITAVDIIPEPACSGPTIVDLYGGSVAGKIWAVAPNMTNHFEYPSGIVIASGGSPSIRVPNGEPCGASLDAHGYLTSN